MYTLQSGKQHAVCDISTSTGETSHCLNAGGMGRIDYESETLIVGALVSQHTPNGHGQSGVNLQAAAAGHILPVAFETRFARNGRGAPDEVVPPLKAQSGQSGKGDAAPCVAYGFQSSQSGTREVDAHATLDSNNGSRRHNGVRVGSAVRRLTPEECEKLQGFPPGYTAVSYRGKLAADGPRYRALGNSMAVPVMAWVGMRIGLVDQIQPVVAPIKQAQDVRSETIPC